MQAMYKFLRKNFPKDQEAPEHPDTPNRWFMLPREIRDQIYSELLCKNYFIQWPARWKRGKAVFNDDRPIFSFRGRHFAWRGVFWSGHGWMIKRPIFWANVALLLTSKAIFHEAIDIMYKGSTFRVCVGQRSERWYRMTPLPSQQRLSRIQNLRMGACVCETSDLAATATAKEAWFKEFNGTDTKRNTCHISYPCHYCRAWGADRTPSFRACKSLVGFKTVILTLQPWRLVPNEEERREIYDSLREEFQAAMEPHLGPSRSYRIKNVVTMEFHPRKHLESLQSGYSNSGSQTLLLAQGKGPGVTRIAL